MSCVNFPRIKDDQKAGKMLFLSGSIGCSQGRSNRFSTQSEDPLTSVGRHYVYMSHGQKERGRTLISPVLGIFIHDSKSLDFEGGPSLQALATYRIPGGSQVLRKRQMFNIKESKFSAGKRPRTPAIRPGP